MVSSSRFSARPSSAALELEQLVDRGVGQAGDAGDAVTDLEHPADLLLLERRREGLDVLAQRRGDVVGVDGELGHQCVSLSLPWMAALRIDREFSHASDRSFNWSRR